MSRIRHFAFLIAPVLLTICAPTSQAEEPKDLFANTLPYADLSYAVYQPRHEAALVVERLGYALTEFQTAAGVNVNVLVATDDVKRRQIIAVRGTSNIENALVNATFQLTENSQAKVPLHDGFARAAEAIYSTIRASLKQGYEISVTGHSLGGGIAVILAMFLDQDRYRLGPVATFGQPKVTNLRGAQAYGHLNVTRFVTPQDLVPLVPPLDLLDINNVDVYWHMGREVVLLGTNEFGLLEGTSSMMRATRVLDQQLGEENLAHHRMLLYRQHIIDRARHATLVEYDPLGRLRGLLGGE